MVRPNERFSNICSSKNSAIFNRIAAPTLNLEYGEYELFAASERLFQTTAIQLGCSCPLVFSLLVDTESKILYTICMAWYNCLNCC